MKRLCDGFDRYRDGELDADEQKRYESHFAACDECRTRSFILNGLVYALKQGAAVPLASPEQVAVRAFERAGSWDVLFLSWLRPAPAWSVLALLLIFSSFLWILPSVQQPGANSEYELLMTESDPGSQAGIMPAALTDDELERWLEQGGTRQ